VVIRSLLDALAKIMSKTLNAIADMLVVIHLLLDALAPLQVPLKLQMVASAKLIQLTKVAEEIKMRNLG